MLIPSTGKPTDYGGPTLRLVEDGRPAIPPVKASAEWQVQYLFHQWGQKTAGTASVRADNIWDAIIAVIDGFEPMGEHEAVEIVGAQKVKRR